MKLRVTEITEDFVASYHNQTHIVLDFSDRSELKMTQEQFDAIRDWKPEKPYSKYGHYEGTDVPVDVRDVEPGCR